MYYRGKYLKSHHKSTMTEIPKSLNMNNRAEMCWKGDLRKGSTSSKSFLFSLSPWSTSRQKQSWMFTERLPVTLSSPQSMDFSWWNILGEDVSNMVHRKDLIAINLFIWPKGHSHQPFSLFLIYGPVCNSWFTSLQVLT